jgi:hypothetical protein
MTRGAPARHRGQPEHYRAQRLGIITDLVEAGYVVKEKNGRRNL